MSAFFKTLFGDLYNLAFVAVVVGVTALMVRLGLSNEAVFALPAMLLAGAGGFARR
jgi:hypothetical protein